jgi:hypothetical protein
MKILRPTPENLVSQYKKIKILKALKTVITFFNKESYDTKYNVEEDEGLELLTSLQCFYKHPTNRDMMKMIEASEYDNAEEKIKDTAELLEMQKYIDENFTQLSGISKEGRLVGQETYEAKTPFEVPELSAKISSYLPESLFNIKVGIQSFKDLMTKTLNAGFDLYKTNKDKFKKYVEIFQNKNKSDMVVAKELLKLDDDAITEIVKDYGDSLDINLVPAGENNNDFDITE